MRCNDVVPNKPKTPLRSFRVDDETWDAAKAEADRRGETVTDALRRALVRYGRTRRKTSDG